MKIYIKPMCPYCIKLLSLVDATGLEYEKIDVIADPDQADMMSDKSGQLGVPQVEIANVIIPDYGTEESLVADIRSILTARTVDEKLADKLTSTIVYL